MIQLLIFLAQKTGFQVRLDCGYQPLFFRDHCTDRYIDCLPHLSQVGPMTPTNQTSSTGFHWIIQNLSRIFFGSNGTLLGFSKGPCGPQESSKQQQAIALVANPKLFHRAAHLAAFAFLPFLTPFAFDFAFFGGFRRASAAAYPEAGPAATGETYETRNDIKYDHQNILNFVRNFNYLLIPQLFADAWALAEKAVHSTTFLSQAFNSFSESFLAKAFSIDLYKVSIFVACCKSCDDNSAA